MPTRPAARPPKACETAVRCGTAVSGTHDSGTPTRKPTATAPAIQPQCTMPGFRNVPRMASVIATTPASTPLRAVFGSFIQCSEKMNSAEATRYAASISQKLTAASPRPAA